MIEDARKLTLKIQDIDQKIVNEQKLILCDLEYFESISPLGLNIECSLEFHRDKMLPRIAQLKRQV